MRVDLTRVRELLAGGAPLNWVLTGDSITHGLVHTQGARSYVEHMHEVVRGDLDRKQDVLINTAISGWRVAQLLEDFDRRVSTWQPHIVTLMIGTNDCSTGGAFPVIDPPEFTASITDFVMRVRELDAIPVLQTPPAVDVSNAPERARISGFAQAVRDVAGQHGAILVDQFARFENLGAPRAGGIPWGLLNDPFHPNAAGHAVLALELAETLGIEPSGSRVMADLRRRIALST